MNKSSCNAEGPDKVDMSLGHLEGHGKHCFGTDVVRFSSRVSITVDSSGNDIIRLNKKQKVALRKQRLGVRGRLAPGRRTGAPLHRGGGVNKLFRRRGQGVITGLAARKAALLKGVSPLNRPVLNRANLNKRGPNRAPAKRSSALYQRTRPFVSQRRTYAQADPRKAPGRVSNGPFRLRRKWNAPPVNEVQREARQATFLSRRGLKVRAHVQKSTPIQAPRRTQRTRPWRTPLNSSGILTVSIDNPGARTQPEPAHSWSLHPPTVIPPSQKTAPEPERKTPKGVALQFDINSVGKQTAMTLNERFRILKLKRMAAVQQNARGGRFVTVG